jgi:hypothetical protein
VGSVGAQTFRCIPFGGDVHAEHRLGDLVLPSILSVGWWFDTTLGVNGIGPLRGRSMSLMQSTRPEIVAT